MTITQLVKRETRTPKALSHTPQCPKCYFPLVYSGQYTCDVCGHELRPLPLTLTEKIGWGLCIIVILVFLWLLYILRGIN